MANASDSNESSVVQPRRLEHRSPKDIALHTRLPRAVLKRPARKTCAVHYRYPQTWAWSVQGAARHSFPVAGCGATKWCNIDQRGDITAALMMVPSLRERVFSSIIVH